MHDQESGAQTTTTTPDGRVTVDFSFRDTGRGPDVREELVVDSDGTQRSHRLKGKSTFGAPIFCASGWSLQRCTNVLRTSHVAGPRIRQWMSWSGAPTDT